MIGILTYILSTTYRYMYFLFLMMLYKQAALQVSVDAAEQAQRM